MKNRKKNSFFRILRISVKDIDKYSEIVIEPLIKVIQYMLILLSVASIILSTIITFQSYKYLNNGINYVIENSSDFSIKNGELDAKIDESIVIENEEIIKRKLIIDDETKIEEVENKYNKEISENENLFFVLKDGIYIDKNINKSYNELLNNFNLKELSKSDIEEFKNLDNEIIIIVGIFIIYFIMILSKLVYETIIYVGILFLLAYSTSRIINVRIKNNVLLKLAIYALSLSNILFASYIGINLFKQFEISGFGVMYSLISYIYVIAALFMIKADIIKHQIQISRIIEEQVNINKQEDEKKEENEKDKEQNEKDKKEENENNEKENQDLKNQEIPKPGHAIKESEKQKL